MKKILLITFLCLFITSNITYAKQFKELKYDAPTDFVTYEDKKSVTLLNSNINSVIYISETNLLYKNTPLNKMNDEKIKSYYYEIVNIIDASNVDYSSNFTYEIKNINNIPVLIYTTTVTSSSQSNNTLPLKARIAIIQNDRDTYYIVGSSDNIPGINYIITLINSIKIMPKFKFDILGLFIAIIIGIIVVILIKLANNNNKKPPKSTENDESDFVIKNDGNYIYIDTK